MPKTLNRLSNRRAGVTRTTGLLALLAAALLSGCATFTPATPQEQVTKRAAEYWQARIAGNPAQAYALLTPSYRKIKTLEQFTVQYGQPVSVIAAEVVSVNCEAEKCTAKMKLDTKPFIPGLNLGVIDMYVDEIWLMEDGQWWHFKER